VTDDEFRLPPGWRSWPPPIKRELKKLLIAIRNSNQRRDDGLLNLQLAWLESSERIALEAAAVARECGRADLAAHSDELLADIGSVRDELLGLTGL